MSKDTSKIMEELKLSKSFDSFYAENNDNMVKDSLAELLDKLIEEKKLKKTDIIRKSQLNEIYAYQIFSGMRFPDRKKLLPIAIAMELDVNQVQSLLKSAGLPPLYVKIPFDSVVLYGIINKKSVIEINEMLYEYELETLG